MSETCGTLRAVNPTDPHWQEQGALTADALPHDVREWLLDEGSLTERLIQKTGGEFRVQRLAQQWLLPMPSERRLLNLADGEEALVREVALYCFGDPWVYARSVMPASTLSGSLGHLGELQNESLGALLFQNPQLQRGEFQLVELPADSDYIHGDYRQDRPAWARRSRFSLAGKPLIVSEVFLEKFQP